MTKQYKIIFLNDYLYVIDEEAEISIGCYYYNSYNPSIKQIENSNQLHLALQEHPEDKSRFIVLASNDPSLNVPILPDIEDLDLKDEIARAIGSNVSNTTLQEEKDATESCLAILKPKKYSEEELYEKIAYWFGRGILAGKQNRIKELSPNKEKILQSLSPIPKAVKLEIIPSENYQKGAICSPWELKLTNNNEVIVKQWIYES